MRRSIPGRIRDVLVDAVDLVLSRACLGCGQLGPVMCPGCWAAGAQPHVHAASTASLGVPVVVATDYEGTVRSAVNAHKERQVHALGPALGGYLAMAMLTAVAERRRIDVVRIPAHQGSLRRRGFDSVEAIARHSCRQLAGAGVRVCVHDLLGRVHDGGRQVGRSVQARHLALHGSMVIEPRALVIPPQVVLVDDVVTSGATLSEAARALRAGGIEVLAGAAVAGTRRRSGELPIRGSG